MASDQNRRDRERLRRALEVVETQLRAMKGDLERLHRQIRAGQVSGLTDSARVTQEIRQWLRIAMEMETRLEKRSITEDRRDRPRAIDLDAARTRIGCRLDRLRRVRCPGRFPERIE
ncbi:hypothetical protein [Aquicoccus sp.]|uniref:hypothetical protein n=1 Tax=Aquicoccus sp. TaxID=2055851 RepID=UPI00356513E4